MPEPEEKEDKPVEENIDKKEQIIVNDAPILDEVASNMPDVVPDALKAAQDKQDEVNKLQSTYKDGKGRPFNPDIHEADPQTGAPKLTPSGRFKMKARQTLSKGGVNIPQQQNDVVADQRIKIAASKFADVFIITGISFFGDEWKPEKAGGIDERQMLIDANERWMIENGYVEPPAWIDLVMAYGLYSGKRLFQPVTKSRVQLLWGKIKMSTTNLWLKITGKDFKVVKREEGK